MTDSIEIEKCGLNLETDYSHLMGLESRFCNCMVCA